MKMEIKKKITKSKFKILYLIIDSQVTSDKMSSRKSALLPKVGILKNT